ncbi:MAG: MASE1 domain-containing protein [Pseudomonadota bacterium]
MHGSHMIQQVFASYHSRVLLVSITYFAAAGVSIALAREVSEVAAIWTANAFLLGVLLRSKPGHYSGYIVGCMIANVLAHTIFDNAFFLSAGFVAVNFAELLVAFALLRRVMPSGWLFFTSQHVLIFGLVAGLIAPITGGILGGLLVHFAKDVPFFDAFRAWSLADAMGFLLVVPAILAWNHAAVIRTVSARLAEALFVTSMAVAGTVYAVSQPYFATLYLVSPFLLWAAFRLNTFLTAATSIVVCAIVIAATACNIGPLTVMASETIAQRMQFQLFLAIAVLIPLTVAMICEEKARLIDELEQKNAELERYTYTVSHDLKSPLITIQGFLGHLRGDIESDNRKNIEEDIDQIESAATTMDELLQDLLELSRLGVIGNVNKQFSLADVFRNVLDAFPDDVDAVVKVAPGLPMIFGDRARISVVVRNILDNAQKYSRPGVPTHINVTIEPKGDLVSCRVEDNGIGIEASHLERVFELFEKLNPDSPGSGVGLAIIRRTIEAHGGNVWIESKGCNQGTTLEFTLPRFGASQARKAERGGNSYVLHPTG